MPPPVLSPAKPKPGLSPAKSVGACGGLDPATPSKTNSYASVATNSPKEGAKGVNITADDARGNLLEGRAPRQWVYATCRNIALDATGKTAGKGAELRVKTILRGAEQLRSPPRALAVVAEEGESKSKERFVGLCKFETDVFDEQWEARYWDSITSELHIVYSGLDEMDVRIDAFATYLHARHGIT